MNHSPDLNAPAHSDVRVTCDVCNRRFEFCVADASAPLLWECADCNVVVCHQEIDESPCDDKVWNAVGLGVECGARRG